MFYSHCVVRFFFDSIFSIPRELRLVINMLLAIRFMCGLL